MLEAKRGGMTAASATPACRPRWRRRSTTDARWPRTTRRATPPSRSRDASPRTARLPKRSGGPRGSKPSCRRRRAAALATFALPAATAPLVPGLAPPSVAAPPMPLPDLRERYDARAWQLVAGAATATRRHHAFAESRDGGAPRRRGASGGGFDEEVRRCFLWKAASPTVGGLQERDRRACEVSGLLRPQTRSPRARATTTSSTRDSNGLTRWTCRTTRRVSWCQRERKTPPKKKKRPPPPEAPSSSRVREQECTREEDSRRRRCSARRGAGVGHTEEWPHLC